MPQATYLYPADFKPVSARSRGNCEYGNVMQAIWNSVGFLSAVLSAEPLLLPESEVEEDAAA